MKMLLSFVAMLAISLSALAQTVTINTTGNRNKQLVVDGKYYTIANTSATDQQAVVINDLAVGQHTLGIVRNTNRAVSTQTNFTLRTGYDLTITVASNGSVSTTETRIAGSGNAGGGTRLSTQAFNKLLSQTKAKTSSASRASFLETQFGNSTKKMTAKQASQLIQLVNSESARLKLAKQSYVRISDPQNFAVVANLLNSTANKNDLNTYITSLSNENDETAGNDANSPMDNARFTTIYNEVTAETAGDRVYYLNNFFSRDFNYYTSAQAKQLIGLVSTEQDRFTVAKSAYRGVTDKENYSVVYPLLTSYNRSALITYINSYDNTNPRAAMTTANFDKLYQSVYYQNSSSQRYTSINNAFTTTGNYFTVAQAKKLIPLVTTEASRLLLAKAAYKVLVDRSNYAEFNDFLSTTASRNDFYTYVTNYDNTVAGSGTSMSEADFTKLYNSANNAWTSSSRYTIVSDAFKSTTNYFTTAQVRQLLTLINSENDKLSLAKSAYDNTVDLASYPQLYDLFTSASSKNDLAAFIANIQAGGGSTVKIAMSDTEFKSMYRSVQLTFGIGAKYSSLTEIFNTETNYFTVDQAKQLIQLVSSESNRLELAKSSYNNITDPTNFSQVYDLFTSQASKNELLAYVNSNAYNR
jgi:hypothetical protein